MENTEENNERRKSVFNSLLLEVSWELSVPHRFVKVVGTGEIAAIFPLQPTQADVLLGEFCYSPKFDEILEFVQMVEDVEKPGSTFMAKEKETEQGHIMEDDPVVEFEGACGHSLIASKYAHPPDQQPERVDLADSAAASEETPRHSKVAVVSNGRKSRSELPRRCDLVSRRSEGTYRRKRSPSVGHNWNYRLDQVPKPTFKRPCQVEDEAVACKKSKSSHFLLLESGSSQAPISVPCISGSQMKEGSISQTGNESDSDTISVGLEPEELEEICDDMETFEIHGNRDDGEM